MNFVSNQNSCFAPLAGMVSRCSSELPKSIGATLLQVGKTLRLSPLLWNLIASLVYWSSEKYKYPGLYGEKEAKKMAVKITLLNLFQSICQALRVYPCVEWIIFQFQEPYRYVCMAMD